MIASSPAASKFTDRSNFAERLECVRLAGAFGRTGWSRAGARSPHSKRFARFGFGCPRLETLSSIIVLQTLPVPSATRQHLDSNYHYGRGSHFIGFLCRIGPKNRRDRQRLATKVADKGWGQS